MNVNVLAFTHTCIHTFADARAASPHRSGFVRRAREVHDLEEKCRHRMSYLTRPVS